MCQPWAQVEFRIQGADDGIKNADGHVPFIAIDFLGSNNLVGIFLTGSDFLFHLRLDAAVWKIRDGGQVNFDNRPRARHRLNCNPAVMSFNDTVDCCHSKAAPEEPCRKKWVEYPFAGILIHALAVICNR